MRTRQLVPVALTCALALAGCGSSSGGDSPTVSGPSASTGTTTAAAPLASLLPPDIAAKGTLVVGSDVSYPPVEFKGDSGDTEGIDPDLAAAIGKELGVKLQFQNATFDGLITSLTSKRIDLVMSALSDNKKRQASVDFVDYFNAGTSIIVKSGNPAKIQSVADFCGKTIALQRGTTQEDVAKAQQAKCPSSSPLKVLAYDTDPEALLQVQQGRAVADMNDFPVAAYTVKKSSGAYEVVGEQIGAGPYGIAVRKDQTQLRDAIQKAVQALIADGTYGAILKKWDVTQGALTTATINAGT